LELEDHLPSLVIGKGSGIHEEPTEGESELTGKHHCGVDVRLHQVQKEKLPINHPVGSRLSVKPALSWQGLIIIDLSNLLDIN
jgi:hypothetical protein